MPLSPGFPGLKPARRRCLLRALEVCHAICVRGTDCGGRDGRIDARRQGRMRRRRRELGCALDQKRTEHQVRQSRLHPVQWLRRRRELVGLSGILVQGALSRRQRLGPYPLSELGARRQSRPELEPCCLGLNQHQAPAC